MQPNDVSLLVAKEMVTLSDTARNLGVLFDSTMAMSQHITATCKMINFHLYSISRIRKFLTTDICHQVSLQSDINAIGQWSESNGMKLNITKTKVMHMTRSKKIT